MLPGDTTIVVAPTNVGKSTSMITVLAANIRRGKSVLFLQHEDSESNIKLKVLCCLLQITRQGLFELYNSAEGTLRIENAQRMLARFFKHIRFVKAGGTVEDVEAIYRRKQDERIGKYGAPFALHVNDYPSKLTTSMARGGGWPKRTIDDYVYDYFVQLGGEYGTHNLLAIQTNREGAKINKDVSKDAKRLLVGEDVQESFGVPQKASNLVTINRDPTAKARGYVTFYWDKSRSSETGLAVVCKSAYERAITHGPDLGAFWYQGTNIVTGRDNIDDLMAQYNGKVLPHHLIGG
jgi:hypothetical protein